MPSPAAPARGQAQVAAGPPMTPRPLRVLHLITGLKGGGAETLLHGLVTHPMARPMDHVVVSMCDDGDLGGPMRDEGIDVRLLGMRPGRPTAGGVARLWRMMGGVRPDIVQGWMYHANLLAAALGRARGTPVVWGVHAVQVDMTHYRRMSHWTMRACAALSSMPEAVVANSEATREDHIQQGYHARRWSVIPNGFDVDRFKPDPAARPALRAELGLSNDTPLVGLVARFDPMKDQPSFLRAARLLAERHPTAHFVLAGRLVDRQNDALRSLVSELGIEDRVHLLGFRRDAARVTAALDVATSTSLFGESFSNTIAEAMACGVPCVVTRVTVLPALVGDTGLVVPPADPPALADAVSRLLDLDPAARTQLGIAARARIEERFTMHRMASSYAALYADLVDARSARG